MEQTEKALREVKFGWSKVEDAVLKTIMQERVNQENGVYVEDFKFDFTKVEYAYLLKTRGAEEIRKR